MKKVNDSGNSILLKNHNKLLIDIEEIVQLNDIPYIDAILQWASDKGQDVEYAASLIKKNPYLKGKVAEEAEKLRLIKT